MKRFILDSAYVYYGTSRYPLNGLPDRFNELILLDGEDILKELAAELTIQVGKITSFPREFRVVHTERQEYPIENAEPIVVQEQIHAMADGYGILWKVAE